MDEQQEQDGQQPKLTDEQRAYLHEVALNGRAISERGIERFGRGEWDAMVNAVASAIAAKGGCSINDAQMQLADAIRFHDDPVEIVRTLAEDEDRRTRLLSMPAPAQKVELARIEAQNSPHGRRVGGAQPAWLTNDREGHVSDADWTRTAGDHLSDETWSREFDRRMEKRFGIAPGRFKTGT